MCSNVLHDGTLSRPIVVKPSWLYANMTSARRGTDHFSWMGCHHASPCGPLVPTDVRETTEARWDIEARRLLELRTAAWPEAQREKFARLLGFKVDTEAHA